MDTFFLFLVYLGGGFKFSETNGFWKSIFWPYYLGRKLSVWMEKTND
jgi:hypothetical protein